MKNIIAAICLASLPITGFAQSFRKGQTDINAGVALLTRFNRVSKDVAIEKTIIPAVMISAERAISNRFSLGISGGLKSRQTDYPGAMIRDTVDYTALYIGPRASWHFIRSGRIDAYTGASVYYAATFKRRRDVKTFDNIISPIFFVGARYRITESLGAFLELDPGLSGLQLGANVRFGYEKIDKKKKSSAHRYKK